MNTNSTSAQSSLSCGEGGGRGSISTLRSELQSELITNILPYWINNMQDEEHGGFYGRIDGQEHRHKEANKGLVLNARILWTFSIAYRVYNNPVYRQMADRAYVYIVSHFIDKEYGGVYWELDYKGNPVNTRKQTYAQGFAIYGLSEYYRATADSEALGYAKAIFGAIEEHAYDPRHGGYIEALTRDWQRMDDMRLSPKDTDDPKSMNTHLHILEPYTNLLRVWDNELLRNRHKELIHLFCDHIIDPATNHLILFFTEDWVPTSAIQSYGHDIESAWLLYEAAEVADDKELMDKVMNVFPKVIAAAYEGLQPDGSMAYERHDNETEPERHWWVQAEAVVGSVYAFWLLKENRYLDIALKNWEYINAYIIDKEHGEWVWGAYPDGSKNRKDDKAGFWKCPYHNARMCIEVGNIYRRLIK